VRRALPPSYADCLESMGASASWSLNDLSWSIEGNLYINVRLNRNCCHLSARRINIFFVFIPIVVYVMILISIVYRVEYLACSNFSGELTTCIFRTTAFWFRWMLLSEQDPINLKMEELCVSETSE
jgi:hypothetical protein